MATFLGGWNYHSMDIGDGRRLFMDFASKSAEKLNPVKFTKKELGTHSRILKIHGIINNKSSCRRLKCCLREHKARAGDKKRS